MSSSIVAPVRLGDVIANNGMRFGRPSQDLRYPVTGGPGFADSFTVTWSA